MTAATWTPAVAEELRSVRFPPGLISPVQGPLAER
jgi:hypothetical protein